MSIHITGGSLGYSLAPLLFAPYVGTFGLTWTPLLALPGLALLAGAGGRAGGAPVRTGPGGGFAPCARTRSP